MKLETRYKKTKCIDGCELFNDEKSYSYWENKKETLDEIEILEFLNSNNSSNSSKILHIGIGNSYISSNLNKYSLIDGISISSKEILLAKNLNIKNYDASFKNKYEFNTFYKMAYAKGFLMVSASPLTRSSYHASNDFKKLKKARETSLKTI